MKRIFAILLCSVMMLCMTACQVGEGNKTDETKEIVETTNPEMEVDSDSHEKDEEFQDVIPRILGYSISERSWLI